MSFLTVEDALARRSLAGKQRSSPRSSLAEFTEWPFNSQQYAPDLENGIDIQFGLEQLESEEFGQTTAVRYLSTSSETRGSQSFINRFLMKSNVRNVPKDSKKLQIAPPAFRLLFSELGIPPAFVGAISRFYQPSGRGSRILQSDDGKDLRDFWYILPVRVQVQCTDTEKGHASSTAGSNQMDPFHYLHLPDEKVDVRGSHIGIYSQHNLTTDQLSVVAISFQDGRWSRVVEEPQRRVRKVLESHERFGAEHNHFSVHLIYLTSALRLWNNVLGSFNNQLIAHEKSLQNQMDNNLESQREDFNNNLNKTLHTMTAHLHRYGSELGRLADIFDHVGQEVVELYDHTGKGTRDDALQARLRQHTVLAMAQTRSQLQDINVFRQELEHKTQNILALLFNNIQVSNDKVMVANGKAMNRMLKASRAEARMSMRLAEEMKKDSAAMKTIAILTTFFLPGTSFAAILSMPFFSQNSWMGEASRVWLWVALTIPATALAFAFYQFWKARQGIRASRLEDATAAELSDV
ncbi:hypothetical protein H2204_012153 [Knufia peltigerae]|uniref:Uncharacterized protein n=1 Tax=Knufia peltigerae TaxID=1002370 RepID=A0AA38XSW5_9EURO|nr:hypothetical protein H2204_012153 [Knufia peltigerae]